jgi:DNA-binding response OmpR family regulator
LDAAGSAGATILVCDDEDVLLDLIRATLDGRYALVEASDGDEALRCARERRPDLMLLDMMMPGRSGLDVLRELRHDPELARVPVIMLTARTQVADREAAAEAGADYFLAKPFSPTELLAVVADVLERTR